MATKDDKRNEQLFRNTRVKKLVQILNELDQTSNNIVIRGVSNGNLNDATKSQLLSQIRSEVMGTDPKVREWIKESVASSYVDGMNLAGELSNKAVRGLEKELQLYKWSGGEKGTIEEKINASFGQPTVGQGIYFSLDPNSSSDFGDTLHSFVAPKKELKLYDSTAGQNTTSNTIDQLSANKLYQDMLRAGESDFVGFAKKKGYDGVVFFSDDGKHKWVALNQKKVAVIKETPPPPKQAPKIDVEMLRTDINMKPHLDIVNTLISKAYADFGNTMTGYVKGAEQSLNQALKQQLRSQIAFGSLQGEGIQKIRKGIVGDLKANGFSVLIDRGGRQWSLGRYGEMLARTHVLDANNEAIINRASETGTDIVEVSNHNTTTQYCNQFEGKIYSLSGNSKNYPKLPEEPPFHPNCKHFLLLRPDLD